MSRRVNKTWVPCPEVREGQRGNKLEADAKAKGAG